MPDFVKSLTDRLSESQIHGEEGKKFLNAFLGSRIEKEDETGRFAINPLTGEVELESPGGFKVTASPLQRSVQGSFRFGGPDTNIISRAPEQALNEALGVNPEMQYGPEPVSAGRRLMEQEIGNYLERNPYGYR